MSEQSQLDDLKRLSNAAKLAIAQKMRKGEDVPVGEIERAAKLDVRISTFEQFLRLRELTRQPGVQPTVQGTVAARATTKKRKATRAPRTKTQAD